VGVPRYVDRVPGLGRKLCPYCSSRKLATVRVYRWEGPTTRGTCTELRCLACGAAVFRELGTSNMTAAEHTAWRNARQLAAARALQD
jgi:hypothetical protein